MKFLVINADDFGYSEGINRGIIEAHNHGIVTSTSVMVDEIAAQGAKQLVQYGDLSIGLHFAVLGIAAKDLKQELQRQVEKFEEIVGQLPDHIDTHKLKPSDDEAISKLLSVYSEQNSIPVRSLSWANLIESYFGLGIDGEGALNENNVSIDAFKSSIDEVGQGYNELMCHVGYSDEYLRRHSSYNDIREQELSVMISREAKNYLQEKEIELCTWREVPR